MAAIASRYTYVFHEGKSDLSENMAKILLAPATLAWGHSVRAGSATPRLNSLIAKIFMGAIAVLLFPITLLGIAFSYGSNTQLEKYRALGSVAEASAPADDPTSSSSTSPVLVNASDASSPIPVSVTPPAPSWFQRFTNWVSSKREPIAASLDTAATAAGAMAALVAPDKPS